MSQPLCDVDGKFALPTNIQTHIRSIDFLGQAEARIKPGTLGLKDKHTNEYAKRGLPCQVYYNTCCDITLLPVKIHPCIVNPIPWYSILNTGPQRPNSTPRAYHRLILWIPPLPPHVTTFICMMPVVKLTSKRTEVCQCQLIFSDLLSQDKCVDEWLINRQKVNFPIRFNNTNTLYFVRVSMNSSLPDEITI